MTFLNRTGTWFKAHHHWWIGTKEGRWFAKEIKLQKQTFIEIIKFWKKFICKRLLSVLLLMFRVASSQIAFKGGLIVQNNNAPNYQSARMMLIILSLKTILTLSFKKYLAVNYLSKIWDMRWWDHISIDEIWKWKSA